MTLSKHDWMQAWVNLIHTATHLRAGLEERLKTELGIGLPEQELIKQLAINGNVLTLTELAKRIYFSKAGVTKMLDRLEDSGLVRRQPVEGDRRSLRAVLTPKGLKVVKKSRVLLSCYVQETLTSHLSERDILQLKDILQRLLERHGVWEGQQRHLQGKSGEQS